MRINKDALKAKANKISKEFGFFTKQNKVVIEYFKRKQGILLKSNYCGCKTLGENKEQNRFYRKGGIAAEAVLS